MVESVLGKMCIENRLRQENAKADALSHNLMPCQDTKLSDLLKCPPKQVAESEFHLEQRKDPELQRIIELLESGTLLGCEQDTKQTAAQAPTLVDEVLYSKGNEQKHSAVPIKDND